MKSILMSIQPKWVEKIISGEKTIEVRKTAPKKVPFKVYVYCTYGRGKGKSALYIDAYGKVSRKANGVKWINGKVIGEFVVRNIESFSEWQHDYPSLLRHIDLYAGTEGDYAFLNNYLKGKKHGYAWHISDLKIYDEPKELREFFKPCLNKQRDCANCAFALLNPFDDGKAVDCGLFRVTRPPQSYMWIQEAND